MKNEKRVTTVDIENSLNEKLNSLNNFNTSINNEIIKNIEQGEYSSPTHQSNERLKNVEKKITDFNQTTNELYKEIKNIKAEMILNEQENKKSNWKIATYSALLGAVAGGIVAKIIDLLF